MTRRLSEWARAQKVILSILTTLIVGVGGTAGVMGAQGSPSSPGLADDLAACETRVSALEAAIAANKSDHEAILRSLADLRTDIRDMRNGVRAEVAR